MEHARRSSLMLAGSEQGLGVMALRELVGRYLSLAYARAAAASLPPEFRDLLDRLGAAESRRSDGDREFKKLLTGVVPALRQFARNLCRDDAMADDLVQETMLKAWAARHRFQPGTSIKAWTHTILRNVFLSQMRRRRFTGDYDEAFAEVRLSAQADQEHRLHVQDVVSALAKMPDAQRDVLLLVGAEEHTYEEAAELQGVPLGTVKSRVARGRAALARLVNGEVPA